MEENKGVQLFTQENDAYCGCFPTKTYKPVQEGEYVKKDKEYDELLALKDKAQEYDKLQEELLALKDKAQEYDKLQEEKQKFQQEKENCIKKYSEEYKKIAIDGVAYDKWCDLLKEKDVKREMVNKIIKKQDVYNFYNTRLTEINKMPGDIDIIYDNVNQKWLKSEDLTKKKIQELNKSIERKKCYTDLACCVNNKAPVFLNGKNYNLKDAFAGKYKKVLVVNGQ